MVKHNCMQDFLCDSLWEWYKNDDEDMDDNNIVLNEALLQASNQYEAEESQLQELNNTAAALSKASGSTSNVPSNTVSSSSLLSNPRPLLQLLPTISSSNPPTSSSSNPPTSSSSNPPTSSSSNPPTAADLQNRKQTKKCAEREH